MVNICIIGSSLAWTPCLVTDLMAVFDEQLEIRLVDIDSERAMLCAQWCEAANKHHKRKDRIVIQPDRRISLKDADAVLITITTGGLDAMEFDLKIPEKYGIYATVGDTAGPGGWSRSVRNIPIFRQFAEDIHAVCPSAIVANYTNPMSSLTATLCLSCGNPVVGLCHSYFETKDVIQKAFGLEDWSDISISIAGMNHFTWVTDFRIGKENGYPLLRKKIGNGSLADILPSESADEIGIYSGHRLCIEMYDAFGYLPYPADRHISEFVSFALCGRNGYPERYIFENGHGDSGYDTVRYCDIKRTDIEYRRKLALTQEQKMRQWISGKEQMPGKSRETGAEMICAYLRNRPFVDAVNTLNVGQIPTLPLGCCVETLGVIDGLGIRPLMVSGIPEHIAELMRPHAVIQKWITDGVLNGNNDLLMQALYHDPQCAHLKLHEVRNMAKELLEANMNYASLQNWADKKSRIGVK